MSSYFEELEQAEAEEEQRLYEEHLCNDCKMAEHFIKKGKTDALSIDMEKPMHFTDEQKAWIKNYIIINAKRQREDVISTIEKHRQGNKQDYDYGIIDELNYSLRDDECLALIEKIKNFDNLEDSEK